jgi:hypothetical protein
VREILEKEEKEIEAIIHILKNNIWKVENPQAWKSVEVCLEVMHKVSPDFLVSLLAYSFPVCKVPLSYEKKEKLYKNDLRDILLKIERDCRLNQKESIEVLDVIKEVGSLNPALGWEIGLSVGLNNEELSFLGLAEQKPASPLNPFFSDKKVSSKTLEKWM